MSAKIKRTKRLIYNEKYHDNCHDYLKTFYIERYAMPKYKLLLYQIKENIPKVNICTETPETNYTDIIVCDQHAVIFGHHKDIYPILATYALNACVGLVIYVKKYRVGCLAHIDGLPGYSKKSANEDGLLINFDPVQENIKMILTKIRNLCRTKKKIVVEYYLIGGIFDLSEIMINDIIACLKQFDGDKYTFIFRARNILGPENQSRNICLDTRNGAITYFDYMTNSEIYGKMVNNEGIPKNILKAPRNSEAILDITYEPSFI